jgi:hypothetical protein
VPGLVHRDRVIDREDDEQEDDRQDFERDTEDRGDPGAYQDA